MCEWLPAESGLKAIVKLALLSLSLLWTVALSAQPMNNDDVLLEMHKRLASSERLNDQRPIVFIGEIAMLGPVGGICKAAYAEPVDFTISRLLFGNHTGPLFHAFYNNCSNGKQLPSPPFTLHAKVIVYCDRYIPESPDCLYPVEFTDARLKKVKAWISAIPPSIRRQSRQVPGN